MGGWRKDKIYSFPWRASKILNCKYWKIRHKWGGETILYARVSTNTQKDDLKHQQEYLGSQYPGCRCISDIGSGLNFKRRKFIALMERVAKREIGAIVVADKDRLCRFGFDFVEWFCQLNNCQIVVLNNSYKTPHQELMDDFMAIMHCFSSKLYFLRRYEKEIRSETDKIWYNLFLSTGQKLKK